MKTKTLKVMTVVGTRPEIIRLSRVICSLEHFFDHTLVHTGQNYDPNLSAVFFSEMGLPKPKFNLKAAGNTAAECIGKVISETDKIIDLIKPDALLVLGDTNSCFAALAAKKQHVPVFHMEAGNRCFDMRVPEELNRRIIDQIADVNLTYSDLARENLISERFPPDRVIKTGSPMLEVLHYYSDQIASSQVLKTLNLKEKKFFTVSAHRQENIEDKDRFESLLEILNTIPKKYNLPVVFSTHPRTRKKLKQLGSALSPEVMVCNPFGFFDYIKLQRASAIVLSDSGTISEEASILQFPALNIREAHERPEAMEETSVMMTGLKPNDVFRSIDILLSEIDQKMEPTKLVVDYTSTNVSQKIVRVINSYTNYINRVVWRDT